MHDVQLYGGMVTVGEYYAQVQIGGQTLRVQIDTGSATLAVPVKECTDCKRGDMRYDIDKSKSGIAKQISCESDECGENTCSSYGCGKCSSKRACCGKSDPDMCSFHLNFGDGSGAKGILVRDMLKWGDVEFPVTFGGIRSDSPDFERSQVDGILGMAYPPLACNPSCIMPTFESMLKMYTMKNLFTICITYDSGRIVLGDYDPAMSTQQEINWVALDQNNPPTFYSFPLLGNLKVNEVDLPLPMYSRAIVDSGTTLIVFSHQTFDRFKKYLLDNFCDVPGLCGPDSWFKPAHCTRILDSDRVKLPTLKFEVTGFNITLGPSEYLINYRSKGPEFWCVGIMALNSMSGGVDVIFGNTVMKKYVTIYDREKHRVGFAASDTKCGLENKSGGTAQIPVTDPEDGGGDTGGVNDGKDGGDPEPKPKPTPNPKNLPTKASPRPNKEEQGRRSDESSLLCARATNCSSCASVSETSCQWNGGDNRCFSGEKPMFMCTVEGLAGNLVYVVGGAVVAVVVLIALVAGIVHVYRKRYSAVDSESDSDVQTPLAPHQQVDTSAAFALDDDEA